MLELIGQYQVNSISFYSSQIASGTTAIHGDLQISGAADYGHRALEACTFII